MSDRNYKIDNKIRVKSDDPIHHLHEYDIDLKSNHIYLFGVESYAIGTGIDVLSEPGVEYILANRFIRNLNLCMRANSELPILIHMKTNGGDWTEGMAIYDAIKSCPNPVTILNYSHARSMSSIILQAANKRVTMPNGYFLFHDGVFGMEGTVKQVESAVEFNKMASKTMMDVYVSSMRESKAFKNDSARRRWLRTKMDKKEDVYLSPDEAIEAGLMDEKFNGNWKDLTVYTPEQLSR